MLLKPAEQAANDIISTITAKNNERLAYSLCTGLPDVL